MSHSQAHFQIQETLTKLEKLYENKCLQAEKAKTLSKPFMYQVLKAEADNIRLVIDQL